MSSVNKAFMVPGLPHLTFENNGWQDLKAAMKKAGETIKAEKPDVLVVYSSQWISVLGHSFQADPNPKGLHVDENWYFIDDKTQGDLPFNMKVDVELAKKAESLTKDKGLATMLVNYQGFPIDTGTIVAMKFLNPDNSIPVMIVSSNIYCGREDSEKLGQSVAEAVKALGRKAVFINISSLSHRFLTERLDPAKDRFAGEKDDEWNQKMLELLKAGKNKEAVEFAPEYAKNAGPEMQFKGFYWLMGALGTPNAKADVLAYGPIWGSGAAVIEYSLN